MKMRYFVTGATGFVGSNICRTLVALGNHVSVLSRKKALNWRLADIQDSITVYEGDMLNTDFAALLTKEKPTVAIHCASYGAMPEERDVETMLDVNIKGLIRLVKACRDSSVKLFINSGSSSEYGVKKKPMKEEDVLNPINDYAVTKAAGTLFCQKESRNSPFSLVTLRLFSPYGYYEQQTRFIPSVIQSALKHLPLSASSPKFVRDFVFIEDVVRAYVSASSGNYKKLNGQVINIGSGQQQTLGSVVKTAGNIAKYAVDVSWNPALKQTRQIEPTCWQADISKAKKLLHWMPKVTLRDGLKKTMEWKKSI